MSAVHFLESRGIQAELTDAGALSVKGLSALGKEERAAFLAWIGENREQLTSELLPPAPVCPLRKLNSNGFFVEPIPGKGLVLTADFRVSVSLEAHVILWALIRWDALLDALWWKGPELPRRVFVRGRNLYQLPKGGGA